MSKTCKFGGDWTIRRAEELRQRLAADIRPGPEIELDFGEIVECDTAGLELICSLRKTAAGQGGGFRVAAISPAVESAAAALGLRIEK